MVAYPKGEGVEEKLVVKLLIRRIDCRLQWVIESTGECPIPLKVVRYIGPPPLASTGIVEQIGRR